MENNVFLIGAITCVILIALYTTYVTLFKKEAKDGVYGWLIGSMYTFLLLFIVTKIFKGVV